MQIEISEQTAIRLLESIGNTADVHAVVELAIADYLNRNWLAGSVIDPQTESPLTPSELQSAIQMGLNDINAGRTVPLDINDIRQRGQQRQQTNDAQNSNP